MAWTSRPYPCFCWWPEKRKSKFSTKSNVNSWYHWFILITDKQPYPSQLWCKHSHQKPRCCIWSNAMSFYFSPQCQAGGLSSPPNHNSVSLQSIVCTEIASWAEGSLLESSWRLTSLVWPHWTLGEGHTTWSHVHVIIFIIFSKTKYSNCLPPIEVTIFVSHPSRSTLCPVWGSPEWYIYWWPQDKELSEEYILPDLIGYCYSLHSLLDYKNINP